MYLDYFHLKTQPFEATCDPRFFWFSDKHKDALAVLSYGILENRGFLLLTGEVGTGKTLLIHQLMSMLPKETVAATLPGSDLDSIDFHRKLADLFGLPPDSGDRADFFTLFRERLNQSDAGGRRTVLIIDEAQLLDSKVIDDICILADIQITDRIMISVILVGQPELNDMLQTEESKAIAQHLTSRLHLAPLNEKETASYIRHRLHVAGNSEKIFKTAAIKKIFAFTAGIPRLINTLCDRALLTGFIYGEKKLRAHTIEACAQDLCIPPRTGLLETSQTMVSQESSCNTMIHVIAKDETPLVENMPLVIHGKEESTPRAPFGRWIPAVITPIAAFILVSALIDFKGNSTPTESITGQISITPLKSEADADGTNNFRMAPERLQKEKITIQFINKNKISPGSLKAIGQVAERLKKSPEKKVYIYGYSNSDHPSSNQRILWQQRKKVLKAQFIGKGVHSHQVKVVDIDATGKEKPEGVGSDDHAVIEFHKNLKADNLKKDK